MVFVRTDDPVKDANQYQEMLDEEEANLSYYICSRCGSHIIRGNDRYEGDHYFEIDGEMICESCIDGFLEEHRFEAIE